MKKAQALQLLGALYEERVLGVIGDNEITQPENAAILRAIRVAEPNFPAASYAAPWLKTPTKVQDIARAMVAEFLRDWADALVAEG